IESSYRKFPETRRTHDGIVRAQHLAHCGGCAQPRKQSDHPISPEPRRATRLPGLRSRGIQPRWKPLMSDFQIADHGTVISIRPLNEAARQWLEENVVSEPWQWVQGALCVEARFARDLLREIEEAGFEISR